LHNIYPDESEIKDVLKEIEMRATMAYVQPRQRSKGTGWRIIRRVAISLIALLIVTIGVYLAYETWVKPVILHEFRVRQVTALRNEADAAMAAGDYARARQALEQLQTILPEDPETAESLHRAEQAEKLSGLYGEARALITAGQWDQALGVLEELQTLDAQYRDLPQLLKLVQESRALDKQFQAAEAAFEQGEWAEAMAQYQALHQTDLTFKFDEIQSRLFESHLQYGLEILESARTEAPQVSEALDHFSAALKLRPVDAQALTERNLAETYLAALNSGDQDEQIELLMTIYRERPDYAGRAAAQLLYTNLVSRATFALETGDEEAARADYQQAAQLLVEDPSEAQQKLAELVAEASPQ
jgi:tetratricopeptide (TPR) repeat protein